LGPKAGRFHWDRKPLEKGPKEFEGCHKERYAIELAQNLVMQTKGDRAGERKKGKKRGGGSLKIPFVPQIQTHTVEKGSRFHPKREPRLVRPKQEERGEVNRKIIRYSP